ncbi:hypothetical protein KSS87_007297 [Heliosperma pusillum]|nr:hypothetical protein KSS87_007297 [Heliosperma pusillum]
MDMDMESHTMVDGPHFHSLLLVQALLWAWVEALTLLSCSSSLERLPLLLGDSVVQETRTMTITREI